jgi:hypothetical protein
MDREEMANSYLLLYYFQIRYGIYGTLLANGSIFEESDWKSDGMKMSVNVCMQCVYHGETSARAFAYATLA